MKTNADIICNLRNGFLGFSMNRTGGLAIGARWATDQMILRNMEWIVENK